jgi:rSAM/selenodomain-associated transferase 2
MRLSIVVPVLNEAAAIAGALRRLREQAPESERIVVDGGSEDLTVSMARPFARVMGAPRGRASQMNAGAREATGDWLLFLHADTRLPDGFPAEIGRAEQAGCFAGAFRLRIEGRHPLLPLLAWGANWRTRRRGIALGDQAMFMRRDLFTRLGGFPELPLMEDYALALRLRRDGVVLYRSPLSVITSGRRWDGAGFWRTWWTMRRNYRRFDRTGSAERLAGGYPDAR